MGGEVTLQIALERVEKLRTRAEGLADIRHILRSNRRFDTLSDDAFHRIYEKLFGVTAEEQSSFLKAKTPTLRTAAETRLSLCASTLRAAVEIGVRYVKIKTIRAIFDHIIQTLRLPSGAFCEPLALDYARCLRSLISYQPHAEHLKKDDRERIATFCIECIRTAESDLTDDDNDDAQSGAERLSTLGSTKGLSYRSSRSNFKESADSQSSRSLTKQVAGEMSGCLAILTATPNASPGSKAQDLLSALIGLLQNSLIGESSAQGTFAAINNILAWTRTEDVELTRKETGALVRLIKTYWPMKSSKDKAILALRDELLTCCLHLEPYFCTGPSGREDLTLRAELSSALDVLRSEYSQRDEKAQLQMEDIRLVFREASTQDAEIGTALFALKFQRNRAESNWTNAYMLAALCHALGDEAVNQPSEEDNEETDGIEPPRKRQRLTDEFDDTLTLSVTASVGGRICALQTLSFLAQRQCFGLKRLTQAVEKLSVSCADDNTAVSSWAFLAAASFASQSRSTAKPLSDRWSTIWQMASRAVGNTSACRAACYLLHISLKIGLVPQQAATDLVQSTTSSIDLNGPSILADSVANLLIHIIEVSQQVSPTSSSATCESILSWVFRHFWPSRSFDREYASQQGVLEPGDVTSVVSRCLGQSSHDAHPFRLPVWGPIGQTWLACLQQKDLIRYLLLLPNSGSFVHEQLQTEQQSSSTGFRSRTSCEILVLNHLISETYKCQEEWSTLVRESPRGITFDGFAAFCKCCIVAGCVAFCNTFGDVRRQSQLQKQIKELLKTLTEFVSRDSCDQDKTDVMLSIFSSVCHGFAMTGSQTTPPLCEVHICRTVANSMSARQTNQELNGVDGDDDEMDLDDAFESQESRHSSASAVLFDFKSELAAKFSVTALRAAMTTYSVVIATQSGAANPNEDTATTKSAQIVDYVLALPTPSMLLSSRVISALSHLGVELDTNDSYRLLDHCAENILRSYLHERSEVALCAILDMLSSLAPTLTTDTNESLHELGIDMYTWYTSVALTGGLLSPAVQERVAGLLLQLCHVDTDYGRDDDNDVPSVRTSLFKLVKLGTITVQFYLANRISTIFGLFILTNHEAMFNELQESLPANTDWTEGMSMRLLFLSNLASAWHSLLRPCVYYIFETGGRVKTSKEYATRSMYALAESLKFKTPKKLFRIFAPQLLYTWLETQSVAELPFDIFQYESFEELVAENLSELVAQLLVHSDDSAMEVIVEAAKATRSDLVVRCFAKCQAYCLGRDITTSSLGEAACESRLRKLIGSKEEHKRLISDQFAAIMGQFYLSLQQEELNDKWLEKREDHALSAKALAEVKALGHSERVLPPTQQPCFKSKFLCDQIGRLCRRTGGDPKQPWDSSSFLVAVRMLLDSIEDALGPLHTCLVIRKLRLLICMAGEQPFAGLPLQVLIHSIRPFLADSQCADDVIGVLQYLISHGRQYLQTNLPFLYGTTMIMILQMQRHASTRLDSTTQESQHITTVRKMQNLQKWLVDYLQGLPASDNPKESHAYGRVVSALQTINLPGNSRKGSSESALLMLLLEDGSSSKQLIDERNRQEAIVLLCDNFQPSVTLEEDCLELDTDCLRFASSLRKALQISGLSEPFIAWSAAVLGRAYASSGKRPIATSSREQPRSNDISTLYEGVARSQATIAKRLVDLLFSRERADASLAEYTLRSVLLSFRDIEESQTFMQMLPDALYPAILGGPHGYEPPEAFCGPSQPANENDLALMLAPSPQTTLEEWVQNVALILCRSASNTAIFPALRAALQNSSELALDLLPCIVHILLVKDLDGDQTLRAQFSDSMAAHFASDGGLFRSKQQYLVEMLLYLREQPITGEHTHADRLKWLEIDWLQASQAAVSCDMPTASLLLAESAQAPLSRDGGRRSSSRASLSQISIAQMPQELLLSIFERLEEPDSYYGIEQPASLGSILGRLDYEANGYRSLMFRSAQTDANLRQTHQLSQEDSAGIIRSLSMLNFNSLTYALLTRGFGSTGVNDDLLNTARKLQQWDIVPPGDNSGVASHSFSAFQELSRVHERPAMRSKLQSILLKHVQPITKSDRFSRPSHEWFGTLASLAEIGETINNTRESAIRSVWDRMQSRETWMILGSHDDSRTILSNRNTLFSIIAKNKVFQSDLGAAAKTCRLIELESLLSTSRVAREHGRLQEALAAASQCSDLINDKGDIVLRAEVATKVEIGSVLWELGEVAASVKMLQDAHAVSTAEKQDIAIGRSGLLAQLAHHLSEARLAKPDELLSKYLRPAVTHLQGHHRGVEAGKVFHEFASFCDKQLQNPSDIEDFNRIRKLRERNLKEVQGLESLARSSRGSAAEKDEYQKKLNTAKRWFKIDDNDYQRLKKDRDTFLQQSLENYLRALQACDKYDISILRFFALWLENADVTDASTVANKYLPRVPSWKFVVLMNQLMSRLEQDTSVFQSTLKGLAMRVCSEHPHHTLHHLFALTREPPSNDQAGLSRYNVASDIMQKLRGDSRKRELLDNVFKANAYYDDLAAAQVDGIRQGSKIAVKDLPLALSIVKAIPPLRVPPATIHLPLQVDGNYDGVPSVAKFSSTMRIMSGKSAPKMLTAYASNGKSYSQLFKDGDDLRQDAIMEQVFGEVSKMLQNHQTTRQRNLHVRTYKVIPLSTRSGIIEFVPNSTSFSDFLNSAHQRYYPQDMRNSDARNKISGVERDTQDTRIREYQKVCDKIHPVMRHFFFERFKDPDDWFEKRTAYTRTTATISMLGHVLGLGDRHCQNIMLDEKTGEVVHIDLGIAFEAGRVLPVPELVPFRLSRDVVDGMGVTKTEGVFRRCCEFTLDALREDKENIMTLLNVLRYDPLYTWTLSPLRAKRIQEQSVQNGVNGDTPQTSAKKKDQEAGEADRALSVVEKKLSMTMSTAATVNELIQQATEVRNLATLFHGWAAYW